MTFSDPGTYEEPKATWDQAYTYGETSTVSLAENFYRVAAVATGNVTNPVGLPTIDGYAVPSGEFLLLAGQLVPSQDGIYQVSGGIWSQIPINSGVVLAKHGNQYAGTFWTNENGTWEEIGGGSVIAPGTYVTPSSDITSAGILQFSANVESLFRTLSPNQLAAMSANLNFGGLYKPVGVVDGTLPGEGASFLQLPGVTSITSTGTFTPLESGDYLIICLGGGGGGGGGGSGTGTTNQYGAGGGGQGESKQQVMALVANTAYTCTIGAGGTAGSGAASGGNGGSAGGQGGNTTFAGPTSLVASGGGPGQPNTANNGSTAVPGGSYGTSSLLSTVSSSPLPLAGIPGSGGPGNSVLGLGYNGGGAIGIGPGGGGAGGAAFSVTSKGGGGGNAAAFTVAGAGFGGGLGASTTTAGVAGGSGAANSGAGAGGGGGGYTGGAGGAGGVGGSGLILAIGPLRTGP